MTPQPIKQKDAFAISAYVIDKKPKEVSDLIRRNGIMLKSFASKKDIDKGFAALLVTSAPFRKDFSALTSNVIKNDSKAKEFFSADGDTATQSWYETDTFKNAFSTILTTFGTVAQNNSNRKNTNAEQARINAEIELEKARQKNLQLQQNNGSNQNNIFDGGKKETSKGGLGTGAIIGIVAGGLTLVGVIIYFATRKK